MFANMQNKHYFNDFLFFVTGESHYHLHFTINKKVSQFFKQFQIKIGNLILYG